MLTSSGPMVRFLAVLSAAKNCFGTNCTDYSYLAYTCIISPKTHKNHSDITLSVRLFKRTARIFIVNGRWLQRQGRFTVCR